MRRLSILPAFIAFALAAIAALIAATVMVTRIEAASDREIRRLFMDERLEWAVVDVDGLRVELAGVAPDEATRFEALRLASTVVDATHVIDAMEVDPGTEVTPPQFALEILRNDDGVSVIGLAPASLDREAVTRQLVEIAGEDEVTDLLELADYPVPDGWPAALAYSLEALKRLERSKISVTPGRVEVTAISVSAEQRRRLMSSLQAAVPDGVEVDLAISAPRPVLTPFTLRFVIDAAGARFDACSAGTEKGRRTILDAAAAAGASAAAECRLGLGVPSPRWPEAVTAAIGAVARLEGGTVTFSDADVALVAPVGTPQRRFDTVVGELEAALPEVFSLTAVLPERPANGEEIDTAPEFVATLAEGELQLRGRVPDERLRQAVEGFARARFSTAEVNAAMRVTEGLPPGWAGRVFAGLESMSHLTGGELVVRPDSLEIKGDTHDANARDEIAGVLTEQLGSDEDFTINVTFTELVEQVPDLPSPQECVGLINTILAERKITFAPGSDDIDSSARISLDRIAEVMQDCTTVPMEIAGHTDSQGREAMNLALSQRRAEAVLEALMARRVLVANLTARGYGEQIPIADNETEAGREANRRIEFTLRLEPGTVASSPPAEEIAPEDGDDATARDEESGDAAAGTEDAGVPSEAPDSDAGPDLAVAEAPDSDAGPDAAGAGTPDERAEEDREGGTEMAAAEAVDEASLPFNPNLPEAARKAPPLRPDDLSGDGEEDDE